MFGKPVAGNLIASRMEAVIVFSIIRPSRESSINIPNFEELVITFYKKINVAHLDEIKALNEKNNEMEASIALLEARLNKLEA